MAVDFQFDAAYEVVFVFVCLVLQHAELTLHSSRTSRACFAPYVQLAVVRDGGAVVAARGDLLNLGLGEVRDWRGAVAEMRPDVFSEGLTETLRIAAVEGPCVDLGRARQPPTRCLG